MPGSTDSLPERTGLELGIGKKLTPGELEAGLACERHDDQPAVAVLWYPTRYACRECVDAVGAVPVQDFRVEQTYNQIHTAIYETALYELTKTGEMEPPLRPGDWEYDNAERHARQIADHVCMHLDAAEEADA